MISIDLLALLLLTLLLIIIFTISGIDYLTKRKVENRPNLSFFIPCYNDGSTVEETIESIYNSYDHDKIEVVVANDCSSDDSLEVLQTIQKKYPIIIKNNEVNLGKSRTVNLHYKECKYDWIFFLDADIIINKKAVENMLSRLKNQKVVAVTAPYQSRNKGFLPLMQDLEYTMFSFLQLYYNKASTSIWGGCFIVQKKAFEEVHGLSENAITEDMDLALKLLEAGYQVKQTIFEINTYVPDTLKVWFKQKIRWTSGISQNYIVHFKSMVKNPLYGIFLVLFPLLSIFYLVQLVSWILPLGQTFNHIQLSISMLVNFKSGAIIYTWSLLKNLIINLFFGVFSIPFVIPDIKKFWQVWKIIYVIPFWLIYMPLFSIASFIGIIIGIKRYYSLEKGKRAW